jgi:hypothetical protein
MRPACSIHSSCLAVHIIKLIMLLHFPTNSSFFRFIAIFFPATLNIYVSTSIRVRNEVAYAETKPKLR